MTDIDKVKTIATAARRWAMRNRSKFEAGSNLTGMCAIASGKLWTMLSEAGIDARIAIRNTWDDGHCFVLVGEYIVDVTATQFGPDRCAVEIVKAADARKHHQFWRATKIHDTPHSLRLHQRKTGWIDEQTALEQY